METAKLAAAAAMYIFLVTGCVFYVLKKIKKEQQEKMNRYALIFYGLGFLSAVIYYALYCMEG